jgi:hypothetical protein
VGDDLSAEEHEVDERSSTNVAGWGTCLLEVVAHKVTSGVDLFLVGSECWRLYCLCWRSRCVVRVTVHPCDVS